MYKLWATIVKDFQVLTRDWVGLSLMFLMPILLVVVITSVQVSTFELVNENKVPLLLSNQDKGPSSTQLIKAIEKIGMFKLTIIPGGLNENQIADLMKEKDALSAILIPSDFSEKIKLKAENVTGRALNDFGVAESKPKPKADAIMPITLYYHPVLQESFRSSIHGAILSSVQLVESKKILQTLYFSLNQKELPASLENDIINNHISINEIPVSRDGSRTIPNATQHNIPAWTIFAMFFIVASLGSNVVKEKQSGSFVRLKTLPTNFLVALFSKKFTYLGVCMAQVFVIFSIGIWLFPLIGLPKLDLPADLLGLFIVSVICGWCAISYAICIGVFAETQEQANGFGAVSIVILAAIGGLLVPTFAMPDSFRVLMEISPLHWCLESYYGLFLEGGKFKDVMMNVLPLLGITVFIQLLAFAGLKSKNLI